MREAPQLPDDTIRRALLAGFGTRVAGLEFLPVGDDADSWAYRVEIADGSTLFLKVRAGSGDAPGTLVPHRLARLGVPGVLAPLPTREGGPAVQADGFALALYPMVDGRTATEARLSAAQWRQLGAMVRQLHSVPLTPELARLVRRETFRPTRRELVADLDAALAAGRPLDPVADDLAAFWRAHRGVIHELVDQADARGRQLEQLPRPQVLCHADLHTWNVLVDSDRRLWIVDWDEATLAPKERDLMFVVGGIARGLVTPRDTGSFLAGYGETTIDWPLLHYYRYAWAVQDIAAYAEAVLLPPTVGEETRRAAVDGFMELFASGRIVDLARTREERG